jgi:hypothetical protein
MMEEATGAAAAAGAVGGGYDWEREFTNNWDAVREDDDGFLSAREIERTKRRRCGVVWCDVM